MTLVSKDGFYCGWRDDEEESYQDEIDKTGYKTIYGLSGGLRTDIIEWNALLGISEILGRKVELIFAGMGPLLEGHLMGLIPNPWLNWAVPSEFPFKSSWGGRQPKLTVSVYKTILGGLEYQNQPNQCPIFGHKANESEVVERLTQLGRLSCCWQYVSPKLPKIR